MKEEIKKIQEEIEKDINNINDLKSVAEIKLKFISKKGRITSLMEKLREVSNEDKKEFGMLINTLRNNFNSTIKEIEDKLVQEELNKKLQNEKIDISLPSTKINIGSKHIIERVVDEVCDLFISMGYDVVGGPEVEYDYYNFEMLNLPKGNPVRDAQDTFYIKDDEILLRSQTSPVQVRTMLNNKEKTPIRIVCPGKTYRRDDDDATHSHNFTQFEGLLIDEKISLADLKGTLDIFAKKLFGDDIITRFRPSFYPFTEPSVEFDISCFNCKGKGCNICKGTGWITVGGAGVVHPQVLKNGGYDKDKYQGFAFGFGIERLAMLKYDIKDVRTFYLNDLRSANDFDRSGE